MAVIDIISQLKRDEGLRLHPYKDTVGKVTIGYGRNLDDVGIASSEADFMLGNDVLYVRGILESTFPWSAGLDDVRKGVLINMAFNMGIHALAGFRQFLALVERGDFEAAADEMMNSEWSKQVGMRATRLSIQMESGHWQ